MSMPTVVSVTTPVERGGAGNAAAALSPSSSMMASAGGFTHAASDCQRVVIKRPQESFPDQNFLDVNWKKEGWLSCPEYNALGDEHHRLMKKLQAWHISTRCQGRDFTLAMGSIIVRDCCIVSPSGMGIQCQLRCANRIGDSEECYKWLDQLGVQPGGVVETEALARGSDFVFVDANTCIAAITSETNCAGIRSVSELLKQDNPDLTVITTDIRANYSAAIGKVGGKRTISDRLICALSPVKEDGIVCCPEIVGEIVVKKLEEQGFVLVKVTAEEWAIGAADVFAISERRCLMRRLDKPQSELDEDDCTPSNPLYRVKNEIKALLNVKTHFIYLPSLALSGCSMNGFILAYRRD